MRPFFARVGNKRSIAKTILKFIPPHTTYVEAFVGGGSVLFAKEKSDKEVINDLDKDLMNGYKLLKKTSANPEDYNIQNGLTSIQNFVDRSHTRTEDKLLKQLYILNNTFSSIGKGRIYKPLSQNQKINKIGEYKERMKNVQIYNQDYKTIIRKFDSPTTFFFLDPPYEKSANLYKNSAFDYEELATILKSIKGKFLLTLNDSANIREVFKDFKIKKVRVVGAGGYQTNIGNTIRKELFITNYKI